MPPFLYRCPTTGQSVQGVMDEGENKPAVDYYQAVECAACGLIHFVMPGTGKVMGEKDEESGTD